MNRLVSCCISFFCLLTPAVLPAQSARPVIDGPIKHGATMRGYPASSNRRGGPGLAQGSIFTAFGSGLGPRELVQAAVPYPVQLPAEPGGTQVSFQSLEGGETFQAYLIHSSAGQVAGIIPSDVPLGFAEVRIAYDGVESKPTLVLIVDASLGLFTVSQNGQGPGVIQNYESPTSQPLNSLSRPAAPGQYLILWGTGLGAIEGPDNAAPPVGNVRDDVVVRFRSDAGIVDVPADYAGRSPQFPGVDQINVRIPDDGSVELGCYAFLEVAAGNSSGPSVSFALSDTPGQCEHPWGLSAEEEAALDQGETATFIHLYLSGADSRARIANADPTGIALNLGVPPVSTSFWSDAPCNPVLFLGVRVDTPPVPLVVPLPPGLSVADPGQLYLVGPDLRAIQLERRVYDPVTFQAKFDLAEDFFIAGEWTLRSRGGKDVGSFEVPFRVAPLPPLNFPQLVDASADIEFSWDPEPYRASEIFHVFLREANPGQTSGRGVACIFPGDAGSLKISAEYLASLEAEAGSNLQWEMTLEVQPLNFTAPGLDHGQIATSRRVTQEATVVE